VIRFYPFSAFKLETNSALPTTAQTRIALWRRCLQTRHTVCCVTFAIVPGLRGTRRLCPGTNFQRRQLLTIFHTSARNARSICAQVVVASHLRLSGPIFSSLRTASEFIEIVLPITPPGIRNGVLEDFYTCRYGADMNQGIVDFLQQLEKQGQAHDATEPEHSRRFLNLEPDTAKLVAVGASRCFIHTVSNP
jgi:hypothetical protein